MKKLILLLLCSPCFAGTWAMVQHPTNLACGSGVSSCAVTTAATGTGNLLIASARIGGCANCTITSVSGAGTWTLCASGSCHQNDATAGDVDIAYNLSSTSGVTSITVNFSAGTTGSDVEITEVSTTAGPAIFDNSGVRDQSTAVANIAGASFTGGTLSGTNDYILQTGIFSGSASACGTQGGTNNNPNDFPNNNAVCGFINTTTTTANTYTNTSSRAALAVIAFKETAGGAACVNRIALLGAGCN